MKAFAFSYLMRFAAWSNCPEFEASALQHSRAAQPSHPSHQNELGLGSSSNFYVLLHHYRPCRAIRSILGPMLAADRRVEHARVRGLARLGQRYIPLGFQRARGAHAPHGFNEDHERSDRSRAFFLLPSSARKTASWTRSPLPRSRFHPDGLVDRGQLRLVAGRRGRLEMAAPTFSATAKVVALGVATFTAASSIGPCHPVCTPLCRPRIPIRKARASKI